MVKLEIKNLHALIEGKKILNGVNLTISTGEIHSIMGPNGGGKSTLSNVLMGHPKYEVENGQILLDGVDISEMAPDERAKLGLFLGFQYPSEVVGVSMTNFMMTAYKELHGREKETEKGKEKQINVMEFYNGFKEKMKELKMDESFSKRSLNEGFSGGEKKRNEILQMSVLNPKIAILDEIDSGLDVDALKSVSEGINKFTSNKDKAILLITHYNRILNYVKPDFVHILINGKVAKSGDASLALQVEEKGYDWIKEAK